MAGMALIGQYNLASIMVPPEASMKEKFSQENRNQFPFSDFTSFPCSSYVKSAHEVSSAYFMLDRFDTIRLTYGYDVFTDRQTTLT